MFSASAKESIARMFLLLDSYIMVQVSSAIW